MPVDGGTIAAQVGAAQGLWTHTPVDWRGNEPPGTAKPGGWPTDASSATAVFPNGSTAGGGSGQAVAISAISVTGITAVAATINFTLSGPANWTIDYGTTTAYGTQVTGSGNGAQTRALAGLTTVTLYHYRINATPGGGQTSSSGDRTFTTV
jgi:hypothetical protein